MDAALYPRFSEAEFARRHAAVRSLMAAEGVDALVVFGNSGISRHNHADIHYLSGFLGNRNNYAVMTASGEPALFVQSYNHVPNAREVSAIRTEWGGPDSAAMVARHLADAGARKATLGYVGASCRPSRASFTASCGTVHSRPTGPAWKPAAHHEGRRRVPAPAAAAVLRHGVTDEVTGDS